MRAKESARRVTIPAQRLASEAMTSLQSAKDRLRLKLKYILDRNLHLLGREILEAEQMTARFPQFCQPCAPEVEVRVPAVSSIDGTALPELADGYRRYAATFLYGFPRGDFRRLEILANGGVMLDRKIIPNIGLGEQRASVVASIQPKRRISREESVVITPWPHYMPLTYGDFLLHLLPRIGRIVSRLSAEEKSRAVFAYPLAKTAWEAEYLGRMGFAPEQLVDTRSYRIQLAADGKVYAASGEDSAFHQRGAHPADYADARRLLWKSPARAVRRLYLQRKGRRQILNEAELWRTLEPYGFEAIDLTAHTIAQQMTMISEAAVILGAQGANINNMIWCSPGATVVEFFNRGFRPSYNLQMAHSLLLEYHCLAELPMLPHHFSNLNLDVSVNCDVLGKFLQRYAK